MGRAGVHQPLRLVLRSLSSRSPDPATSEERRSAAHRALGGSNRPSLRATGPFTMIAMEAKREVREFLTSRRARITPEQAGLPIYGSRRVPGLRREEVAMLAGVSVDYYSKLERGNLSGVSEAVLDAISRALQLDEAERAHLFDLARSVTTSVPASTRRGSSPSSVRPAVQRLLEAMDGAPAFARNGRFDILAANPLGRALYAPLYDHARGGLVNQARFLFLSPHAQAFWDNWERSARTTVSILRREAGHSPFDTALTSLVGELSTRSDPFRQLWASHDVKHGGAGRKVFNHPDVGRLDLTFESLEVKADPGVTLLVYGAEPDTASADALKILSRLALRIDAEPGPAEVG